MCLIVFAWRPDHSQPLILAANRDEFYARPTLPLAQWEETPHVYAGRDLEAGGTWLGVSKDGRFAALTNIRDPGKPLGRRSRGELVAHFLSGSLSIDEYLSEVAGRSAEYGGFNLLVGNRQALHFINATDPVPRRLQAGVYGVSNAGLDTPWPKLTKAKAALSEHLDHRSLTHCSASWRIPTRRPAPICPTPVWAWPPKNCCPACLSPAPTTERERAPC